MFKNGMFLIPLPVPIFMASITRQPGTNITVVGVVVKYQI